MRFIGDDSRWLSYSAQYHGDQQPDRENDTQAPHDVPRRGKDDATDDQP
jgi:hypothetical protein